MVTTDLLYPEELVVVWLGKADMVLDGTLETTLVDFHTVVVVVVVKTTVVGVLVVLVV
jgi:hypothetical protein